MSIDKKDSWRIFEKIAHRYDLSNRIISFGVDRSWRKKVVSLIPSDKKISVLDLATGTGDLLFSILKERPSIQRTVGVDMSPNMLQLAEKKALKFNIYDRCSFRIGDAGHLHFKNGEWDFVTIAFGIRNTEDSLSVLKEVRRVLKTKGKAIILEFSLPSNRWLRFLYLTYFRYVLPLIGFVVSGRYSAYRYLNATVEKYPYGKEFLKLMKEAKFKKASFISLTFGIATIYIGQK